MVTLMKKMGIEALYPKPRTSKPNPAHKRYPYLLKGLDIVLANHVWCADITLLPMARDAGRITCLSSAYGEASNTRRCILRHTDRFLRQEASLKNTLKNTLHCTIKGVGIKVLTI